MTEKRFYIEDFFLKDKENEFTQGFNDRVDFYELCWFLNKQNDEIIELKEVIKRMAIEMMGG